MGLRWLGGRRLLPLWLALLALLMVWAATQGADAQPRPVPKPLQLAPSATPSAMIDRVRALLEPDETGPVGNLHTEPPGCPPGEDCAAV
jgi:hypothetical protein